MTILDTKFTNIGRHYLGLYEYYFCCIESKINYSVAEFYIIHSVNFTNCELKTFSDGHLIRVYDSKNVILINNKFTDSIPWIENNMSLIMTQSLVEIKICSEKNYMISNVFGNVSYLDANVAALYLQDGSGVNCMSGNIFYNYGLYVDGTNISSCYRPDACITNVYGNNTNILCDNHI
eukprot:15307_1